MMAHVKAAFLAALLCSVATSNTRAQSVRASGSLESFELAASTKDAKPWIERYQPVPHQVELGLFAGLFAPSPAHNLRDPDMDQQHFNRIAPSFGARIGYFPLTFLGGELEGAVMPTATVDGTSATLWGARGQLVAQLPVCTPMPAASRLINSPAAPSTRRNRDDAFMCRSPSI
jgi:hypothetical protein